MNKIFLVGNGAMVRTENFQGLAVIKQALKESEIEVSVKGIQDFNIDALPQNSIVGLSSYYSELDCFIQLSQLLKSKGHFAVLGGHGTYFKDNNSEMLAKDYFDAINRGHAKPFIDFVKSAISQNDSTASLSDIAENSLLATKKNPEVPKGKFPELNEFPLVNYSSKLDGYFVIPAMRSCENSCGFCAEHFSKTPDITDILIESLQKYEEHSEIKGLAFQSPSFNNANIADMRKITSAIKSRPQISAYIDSCQIGDSEKIEILDELNVTRLYIGLNAINDKSAEYLGRNEHGKPRKNVNKEKNDIVDFLCRERKIDGDESYTISIMYSRADGKQEIQRIIAFVGKVLMSTYNMPDKKISININQAIPMPGTKYYNNHIEDYNMNNYASFALGAPHKSSILNYKSQADDFFKRLVLPRYYLDAGNSKGLSIGSQELLFAYEHVFENKISSYEKMCKELRDGYAQDVEFIKNPQYIPKNGKMTVFDTD